MNASPLVTTRRRWLLFAVGAGLLAGFLPVLVLSSPMLVAALVGAVLVGTVLVVGWPFSAVAVLVVAPLLTHYRIDVASVSVRPEHVAVLVVALLGGVQVFVQRGRLRWPASVWLALAWWAVNMLAGAFFSPLLSFGLQNGLRIGASVLAFVLMINLIPDRRQWWWAVWLFLAMGVAEAAFGLLARALYPAGVNLGVQVAWNFTEPIPYGTFEEGNLFGSHVAAWALLLLMLIMAGRALPWSARRKVVLLLGLFVLLLGLYLSLSRAAWLMFVAGAALIWVFHRRDRWHQSNRLLLVAAAVPFFVLLTLEVAPHLPSSWPFAERLQSFLSLESDATFSARLSDWSLALNDWRRQPLTGWGPGSFFDLHGVLRARPAWISNLSVRLLQETGILGMVSFASFVAALLLPALRVVRRQVKMEDRSALLGLTIAYFVLLLIAYQSTDGIWLAASWVNAGLIASGTYVLRQPN